jgi:hypothetical protein
MKLTTYTHHYKLSVNIPKRPFWLTVASFILGLVLVGAAAIWFNTTRTYHYPLSEEEPTPSVMRRLDPSEYSEETKRRTSITDTTGASAELIHYINKYSEEYGVSARYLVCLAREESRFDPNAVGDSGRAVGPFQYWLSTWQMFRRQMGLSTEDLRACEKESVRTTAWAVANGLSRHWSVAAKCAEEKI